MWRARNPEGMAEKQSFQEMLDTSVDKGENFVQFLFNRVLPEWNNLSQVKFCAHMERLNAENTMLSKKTLTDTVLSNWRLGKGKPLRDSAEVICAAFGITPREGERMALHERKLWKIIDGRPFSYGGKTGEQGLIAALADAHKTKDTSALITELIDSSGIRFERLQQVLGVQQISAWKKGARIDNVQTALDFVDMMGPLVPTELMTVSQRATRRELLSLITGREFDIDMLMENASKAGNPGGELLTGLTGRTGLVTITSAELAKKAKTKDFPVTEEQVKKMRTGTQLQRGGKIYEPVAKSILGQVRRAMRPLIAQDIVDPFTPEQEAAAIDMLTRIEHPRTLLAKCAKGEMAIGAMVRDTCERLNLNLMGPRSFCEQVGITHISDFVCGKAHVDANTAKKLSNWFAKNYGFTPGEQQQFMSLAQGVNQARTPDILLADVTAGKLDRTEGLRQIYDYRGFTRDALASQARVDTHVIQYSVNNVSGGRIMADKDAVRRIGAAAGISDAQLDSFVAVYDGQKIRRKDLVKKPAGRTKSWADTTSDTPPSTNGTPPRPGS